jgi:hypothetical protein
MESGHQVGLVILNFKILYTLMFNYMIFKYFATTIFKNHMFKVGLCIFIKIEWKHGGFHNETLKINKKLLSYVYVEKLPYLKCGFEQMYFLVHFTMLGPSFLLHIVLMGTNCFQQFVLLFTFVVSFYAIVIIQQIFMKK